MIINKISAIGLTCLLLATVGCSNVKERAAETVDSQKQRTERKLEQIRNGSDSKDISSVKHSNRVWLGSRGYRQQNGDPLPNKYDNITYMTTQPQTLREIVSDLSSMTGMRFVISDAALSASSDSDSGESSDDAMDLGDTADYTADSAGALTLSYSGDVVGLLNQLATKFDISWEHNENVIYLSKYVTRTLALYSLPSTTELESTITSESDSDSAGGDSGGGGGTQSGTDNEVKLETSLNVWEEVEEVIGSMIPDGSNYAMSPSTGTLTITSTPLAIRKVENLIKKQNEILSRQVVIDINVMTIVTTEVESFEIDWDIALDNLSSNFGLDWSKATNVGNFTRPEGIGNFSSIYTSDSGGNIASLLFDVLSEKFERSNVTNSTVTTLNNHTVPLQIITRQTYIKESETTISDNVVTTAVTPGDITTGFVMNVLPRILANGEIMMQYAMSISELTSLETKKFGQTGDDPDTDTSGSLVQLPTVVSRDFLQNIKLRSGNTLVLAGYDRLINISQDSGTTNPNNYLFGGGKYGQVAKEVLVITITPRIIE